MAERFKAHAWRACSPIGVVGSNPTPSASSCTEIGTVLLEANDDRQLQHRYMQIEGMAELNATLADDNRLALTPQAA